MSWHSLLISDRSWATSELARGGGGGAGACSLGGWTAHASGIMQSLVGRQLGQTKQDSEGRPSRRYNDRRYKIELGLQSQVITSSAQGNMYTCVTREEYNNGTRIQRNKKALYCRCEYGSKWLIIMHTENDNKVVRYRK